MAPEVGIALAALAAALLLWALLMIVYLGCLTAVELVRAEWAQYRRRRWYKRAVAAEIARIDRAAYESVHRIGAAFTVAQELMRDRPHER